MVTKELSEAAVEFNCILSNTSQDIINKIPPKFLNFMKSIASSTYKFDYDKTKTLNEQNLKAETRGLISLVYSDYICDKKEKEAYLNKCQNHLKMKEKDIREKYNPDNLFKSQNTTQSIGNEIQQEVTAIIEYKEKSFIQKIFDKIINLFKRK